jgi:ABC-2 type transport system ATP-binding protein
MTLGDAVEPLVHIQDFGMNVGDTMLTRDVSFDVLAGKTFGFPSNNGSGKTTTMQVLLGIYKPTSGTLHIGGGRKLSTAGTLRRKELAAK